LTTRFTTTTLVCKTCGWNTSDCSSDQHCQHCGDPLTRSTTAPIEAIKSAKRYANIAAAFALWSAALTTCVAVWAMYKGQPVLGIDGWSLLQAGLLVVIAWRIWRLSYPWTVVGIVLALFEIGWKL
jgi:hypothetical protein